jgi:NTP pyrophosphatase (non-canonical NTP hydrolase)
MLHAIYGPTQNYSKSSFEILSHLTEVSSLMSKFLIRRRDVNAARLFLPKMFAWGIALQRSLRPDDNNLERIVLQKFPGVCAYCMNKPCICWDKAKPTPNPERLRQLYYDNAASLERSVAAFQLMFNEIYGKTWPDVVTVFLRLVEELAELAEAVRIFHLYPKNFENELADFFAWWFALSHLTATMAEGANPIERLLWQAYPAQCLDCNSLPCFCSPRPMRELMSKPAFGQYDDIEIFLPLLVIREHLILTLSKSRKTNLLWLFRWHVFGSMWTISNK